MLATSAGRRTQKPRLASSMFVEYSSCTSQSSLQIKACQHAALVPSGRNSLCDASWTARCAACALEDVSEHAHYRADCAVSQSCQAADFLAPAAERVPCSPTDAGQTAAAQA